MAVIHWLSLESAVGPTTGTATKNTLSATRRAVGGSDGTEAETPVSQAPGSEPEARVSVRRFCVRGVLCRWGAGPGG